MEKLANERVVQPGLPLLDEGEFETPKIGAAGEKRDWGPYEQVLMFAPVAQGQFRLNQAVMSKLVVLASATVLPVKYMMKGRPKIEFGLKIVDVCEADIHILWQEKDLGKKLMRF